MLPRTAIRKSDPVLNTVFVQEEFELKLVSRVWGLTSAMGLGIEPVFSVLLKRGDGLASDWRLFCRGSMLCCRRIEMRCSKCGSDNSEGARFCGQWSGPL